jgi:hypothetical protein
MASSPPAKKERVATPEVKVKPVNGETAQADTPKVTPMRMPRDEPKRHIEPLDVPTNIKVRVSIQESKLYCSADLPEGCERLEWQVRKNAETGIAAQRAVSGKRTEFTDYPIGVPGVPQARVRAVGDGAMSAYSDWVRSEHDLGATY